jgi:hypothetical protein
MKTHDPEMPKVNQSKYTFFSQPTLCHLLSSYTVCANDHQLELSINFNKERQLCGEMHMDAAPLNAVTKLIFLLQDSHLLKNKLVIVSSDPDSNLTYQNVKLQNKSRDNVLVKKLEVNAEINKVILYADKFVILVTLASNNHEQIVDELSAFLNGININNNHQFNKSLTAKL